MADPNHLLAWLQPHRVNEEFPELQQLQPLPLTELARRLCHLYAKGGREPPQADLGTREPVTGELLAQLAGYLYLADQSYEGATEAQLSRRLQRKGVGFKIRSRAKFKIWAKTLIRVVCTCLKDGWLKASARVRSEGGQEAELLLDAAC